MLAYNINSNTYAPIRGCSHILVRCCESSWNFSAPEPQVQPAPPHCSRKSGELKMKGVWRQAHRFCGWIGNQPIDGSCMGPLDPWAFFLGAAAVPYRGWKKEIIPFVDYATKWMLLQRQRHLWKHHQPDIFLCFHCDDGGNSLAVW